ncbi:MAG: EI24 domain-containing protein [Deltaproteobacteria bacterium]|nr:EI24 domain-containing protein [Deltaproteobacteria bacterium]
MSTPRRLSPIGTTFAPFTGARVLFGDSKLRGLAALPVLVTLLAYGAALAAAILSVDDLVAFLWAKPEGTMVYLWYLVVALTFFAELLIMRSAFFAIVGVVAGPLYERLAESVLSARAIETSSPSIADGLASSALRLALFALPAFCFGLMSLVPGLGIVFLPFSLFFSALAFAAEVLDPPLALLGMSVKERLSYVLRNLTAVVGLGIVLSLAIYVPFAVLVAVPSAIVGLSRNLEV